MSSGTQSATQNSVRIFRNPRNIGNQIFKEMLQSKSFVDVTLVVGSHSIEAHRMMLAANSSYFKVIPLLPQSRKLINFTRISHWQETFLTISSSQHPIIFLKDITLVQLNLVLDYIYVGLASVPLQEVESFMSTLRYLQIDLKEDMLATKIFPVNNVPLQSKILYKCDSCQRMFCSTVDVYNQHVKACRNSVQCRSAPTIQQNSHLPTV